MPAKRLWTRQRNLPNKSMVRERVRESPLSFFDFYPGFVLRDYAGQVEITIARVRRPSRCFRSILELSAQLEHLQNIELSPLRTDCSAFRSLHNPGPIFITHHRSEGKGDTHVQNVTGQVQVVVQWLPSLPRNCVERKIDVPDSKGEPSGLIAYGKGYA